MKDNLELPIVDCEIVPLYESNKIRIEFSENIDWLNCSVEFVNTLIVKLEIAKKMLSDKGDIKNDGPKIEQENKIWWWTCHP